MKYLLCLPVIAVLTSSCSRTTYSISPSFGYDFEPNSQVIVAKFKNAPTDDVSERATKLVQDVYRSCDSLEIIPHDTIQDLFYRNAAYSDPVWDINPEFLIKLYTLTKARYLLTSEVVDQSASRAPVSIAESYGNGQIEDMQENWVMVKFALYDLAKSEEAFTLHTRTKAGRYNYNDRHGDVVSLHAPVDLLSKAFDKSLKKLTEMCACTQRIIVKPSQKRQ